MADLCCDPLTKQLWWRQTLLCVSGRRSTKVLLGLEWVFCAVRASRVHLSVLAEGELQFGNAFNCAGEQVAFPLRGFTVNCLFRYRLG